MAANISPKEFYSLVRVHPSRAHQCLSSIPLDSRQPYITFRNEEGEEYLHGQIALHAAARAGHAQLVQLLLDSNSDKDARTNDGATPIYIASFNRRDKVVELLLSAGADLNSAMNDGATPIMIASFKGHDKVVELLLAAGADKDAATNSGATPIYVASRKGHDKVVELLLAAGADMNAAINYGATPIMIASFIGHDKVVELLLAAGADKNAATNDGRTSIWEASFNGHDKVVELLLAAGADKDVAKNDGATPIFVAAFNGHNKVVELLLAAGADKNAATNTGRTPVDIASQRGNQSVVDLLLAAGALKSASIRNLITSLFRSPAPQLVNDAYYSRQAELVSRLTDTRSSLLRFNREAPFRSILDSFQISSSSRNLLFLTHGLELSTLEHVTIEVLKDVLKDNIPHLPTLKITALFKALQKVTLTPALHPPHRALPVDFPHLDNLLIPLDNLKIESTAFAEGADGKVFLAEYHGFSVAVKMLTTPDASFRKELEKWCQFRHPNILLLIGFSQPSNSLPLIVMELMDQSLFDLLNDHKLDLSWESRLKMAHGIAAGLVYLHEIRNIIHRDIKSLNILVKGRDNEVKIADFGASRGNTSLVSRHAGTDRWLAPELYENRSPTYAVDIYSFGITLNELSTRRPPFLELGNNFAAIMKAVTSNQCPKMEPFPSADSIPSWHHLFLDLIQKCWDQDPLQRPSATMAFQPDVEAIYSKFFFFTFHQFIIICIASSASTFHTL